MEKQQQSTIQKKYGQQGSAFSRYRRSTVGDCSITQLFIYELITFFCIPAHGEIGKLLRKLMLPFLFGKFGKKSQIGSNCTIRNGKKIQINSSVKIEDKVTLDVKPGGQNLIIEDQAVIGEKTIINCGSSSIKIGRKTVIGSSCRLGTLKGLIIGEQCSFGDLTCISGASHSFSDLETPIIQQPITCKGATIIGDCVEIGERVTILDGITIGDHVKIHPDSLVNKDIGDGLTVSGVPARPVAK